MKLYIKTWPDRSKTVVPISDVALFDHCANNCWVYFDTWETITKKMLEIHGVTEFIYEEITPLK